MPFWHRLVIVGGVILASAVIAKVIDLRMARKKLAPGAETRYRVLRRSIMTAVVFVGLLSALLVIPQVRAVAGGLLASSAVVGIVVGFASQRTLGNFVAGLLIAFTQPLRLGDEVEIDGTRGVVEEIGLIYTFVRTDNDDRLVIPNETLASDTIRNATIRSREKVAEVTVQVPLNSDLGSVVDRLTRTTRAEVFVRDLAAQATVAIRARAVDEAQAGRLVQGGSTITQQLVRSLYIKKKSQTLGRKATEACLAIKLAREKSKRWILTAYMNQVFYGNHAYGIEAASQTYFSKKARKLTLRQAALLAGLPQAPSVFDPFHRPTQALARRNEVLRAMLDSGYITSTQYAKAISD